MEVEDAAGGDGDVAGTEAPQARLAGVSRVEQARRRGRRRDPRRRPRGWRLWRLRAVRRRGDKDL
eukprot:1786584-Prymnesium_polylepis.1